jgi:hypothetical protein
VTTPNTPLLSSPYLRVQRLFPYDDVKNLSGQIDQAYIDIATKVNLRTIGIFPTNFQVATGETWYLAGGSQRQQTLRQVYPFGPITPGTTILIPTGININTLFLFTRIYGEIVTISGTNFRPIPYINPNLLSDGIGILVGNFGAPPVQNIQIIVGATSPAIGSGFVVLEWLSQF